jgi:signal transduction histidine kinase
MMLLYALVGGAFGASLGYIFRRLEENRRLLKVVHHEFELQVATLRHHYKNLALGISGFSQRIRRKVGELDQCLKECDEQGCPRCAGLQEDLATLEGNATVLDEAARRLNATLARELLFLRALTSETLALEHRDLYPLVKEAVRDLLSLRFRDKDLTVEINGRPWEECRDSLTFSFEPTSLEVMVQNLLSNAMKYGDHIRLDLEDKGGSVHLTVQDNGPGLDVAKLRRDLAAPGELREADSTRLGLRVILHLLGKMNGRLWVASSPGSGAAFILEIPQQSVPRHA